MFVSLFLSLGNGFYQTNTLLLAIIYSLSFLSIFKTTFLALKFVPNQLSLRKVSEKKIISQLRFFTFALNNILFFASFSAALCK